MKVQDSEMTKINGGQNSLGVTIFNYLGSFLKVVFEIGQGFGGSLRRISTGNVCKV